MMICTNTKTYEAEKLLLRRKGRLIVEEGEWMPLRSGVLGALAANVTRWGYCFGPELLAILETWSDNQLVLWSNRLFSMLRELTGDDVGYEPFYPNFPRQVMNASCVELYINALIHYATEGTWLPDYPEVMRPLLEDQPRLKVLEVGTEEDLLAIAGDMLMARVPLAPLDRVELEAILRAMPGSFVHFPEDIPCKENLALAGRLCMAIHGTVAPMAHCFRNATDVLRLAVALSNGDASLGIPCRFRAFSRAVRRMLLGLLENCGDIEADMARWESRWLRLGERLHPGEYGKDFPKAYAAFRKLREGEKIRSWNGRTEILLEQGRYLEAARWLAARPGEFARRLDLLLRKADAETQQAILELFAGCASGASTMVLLQLRQHLENRPSIESRLIFPKGAAARAYRLEAELPPIDEAVCRKVMAICEDALRSKYAERTPLGKVWIDPALRGYYVPFGMRNASKGLRTLVRGSRIPLEESCRTIRAFIWWKNGSSRTDIDLSCDLFDERWGNAGHLSYTNLQESGINSCHSGDVISAPKGACEFIDIDVDQAAKAGVRYLAFNIFSYSAQPFDTLPECRMGWMARSKPGSGEVFEPSTVRDRIDIRSHSCSGLMMLVDTFERCVIWCNLEMAAEDHLGGINIESNRAAVWEICSSIAEDRRPDLYTLFRLHAEARGELVEEESEADIRFAPDRGITPFDTEVIMAEYI